MGWLKAKLRREPSRTSPRSAGEAEGIDDVEPVEEGPGQHSGEDEAGDDVGQGDERVLADIRRAALQLGHQAEEDLQGWRRWW